MPQRVSRTSESGQALPLLLVVLVLATAVAVLVADLGVAAVQRARARTAADAAALAGAAEGEPAARLIAADNGAEVVSYERDGIVVEVAVRVGDATARATAEGQPPVRGGAVPALAAALARAAQILGRPVPVLAIVDGGTAVEVAQEAGRDLDAIARDSGLCRQAPAAGPVHFEPCPPPTSPG